MSCKEHHQGKDQQYYSHPSEHRVVEELTGLAAVIEDFEQRCAVDGHARASAFGKRHYRVVPGHLQLGIHSVFVLVGIVDEGVFYLQGSNHLHIVASAQGHRNVPFRTDVHIGDLLSYAAQR